MQKSQVEILPGLKTEVWSYNGMFPGPTIRQRGGSRKDGGRQSVVRFINQLGNTLEAGKEVPIININSFAWNGFAAAIRWLC